jgi:hypothetical protein
MTTWSDSGEGSGSSVKMTLTIPLSLLGGGLLGRLDETHLADLLCGSRGRRRVAGADSRGDVLSARGGSAAPELYVVEVHDPGKDLVDSLAVLRIGSDRVIGERECAEVGQPH